MLTSPSHREKNWKNKTGHTKTSGIMINLLIDHSSLHLHPLPVGPVPLVQFPAWFFQVGMMFFLWYLTFLVSSNSLISCMFPNPGGAKNTLVSTGLPESSSSNSILKFGPNSGIFTPSYNNLFPLDIHEQHTSPLHSWGKGLSPGIFWALEALDFGGRAIYAREFTIPSVQKKHLL